MVMTRCIDFVSHRLAMPCSLENIALELVKALEL